VPGTYRESFGAVVAAGAINAELASQLAPSAGLRNILTHEYVAIDLEILTRSVPMVAELYRLYVESVAKYLTATD
jgi:uncharacterized protein YutE (UPF0331/DUF86 family)